MPDTGAPWNIPYVDPTDLVRDYPQASEDLADAIADGLDAAGGLVAVKTTLFTSTQSNSTAAGANFAITNLSITHTLADAANKLVFLAFVGAATASTTNEGRVGIAVADNGTLIQIGNAASSRARSTVGGNVAFGAEGSGSVVLAFQTVYTPGDANAHTYTLRAINGRNATETVFINRNVTDSNSLDSSRTASGFTLMEVKV
jgi:hypothetical protein